MEDGPVNREQSGGERRKNALFAKIKVEWREREREGQVSWKINEPEFHPLEYRVDGKLGTNVFCNLDIYISF